MTDKASENQSFFNSIIGNTTERTTVKLITFYKTFGGLGLLISKAKVGSYIAIANDSSSLIPKPDSKFPSSKSDCTDLNKWHVISVTWAIGKDLSSCWCNAEKLITVTTGNIKGSDHGGLRCMPNPATILQLKMWQNCLTTPGSGKRC